MGPKKKSKKEVVDAETVDVKKLIAGGQPQKPVTIDQMIESMDNELTLVFEHAKNDAKRVFNTLLDALKGASSQLARYGSENEKLKKICKDRGIKFEKLLEEMPDQPKPGNRKQRRAAAKREKKSRKK